MATSAGSFELAPACADRLPRAHLRLAVAQAIRDRLQLSDTQERLWREDADVVAKEFTHVRNALMLDAVDHLSMRCCGGYGLHAERMRELRRPLPMRRKRGLTLADIAGRAGMDRETLACLMEHHGYLALVPYGGEQRRRLVTDHAFAAGLGHNAAASNTRVAAVEGMNRAGVFPVFYPERLPDILWTLDYEGIVSRAAAIPSKRNRLRWLLEAYGFLPNAEMARLSGYTERSVERARAKEEKAITADEPLSSGNGYLLSWVKAGMPR